MCPFCLSVVAMAERDLLTHVLSRHPLALAILGAVLTIANIGLAKRPQELLLMDLGVLSAASFLARGPGLVGG